MPNYVPLYNYIVADKCSDRRYPAIHHNRCVQQMNDASNGLTMAVINRYQHRPRISNGRDRKPKLPTRGIDARIFEAVYRTTHCIIIRLTA